MAEMLSTADIRDIRRYAFQNPHMSAARMAKIFNLREEDVRAVVNEQPKQSEPVKNQGNAGAAANYARTARKWAAWSKYWLEHPDATVRGIAEKVGCTKQSVYYAIKRGMLTPPADYTAIVTPIEQYIARKCPTCGTDLVKGAKFCHACGAKIVSKRSEAISGIEKVLNTISALYPANSRDSAIKYLNAAIDFIEKNTEEE